MVATVDVVVNTKAFIADIVVCERAGLIRPDILDMPVRNVDGESTIVARKSAPRGFVFFLTFNRDLENRRVNLDGWYSLGLLFSSFVAISFQPQ